MQLSTLNSQLSTFNSQLINSKCAQRIIQNSKLKNE